MVASSQITPGMVISVADKLYRVESSVKVTVTKGAPFIKTKLRKLATGEIMEKNFKPDQQIKEVALAERTLEFLYLEGDHYLLLDVDNLEQVLVPAEIVGDRANYLKEGVQIKASFYASEIFSVELPQFLELMVSKTADPQESDGSTNKMALLETGAKVEVPPFIESGDIIRVDTKSGEYIQRV